MGIWYLTATTSGELERRLQDHQPGLLKGRLVQTTHLKCRNRIEMAPGHFTYSPEPALEIVIGGEVGACNPAEAGRPKVPRSETGAPVSGGQSLPRAASARERGRRRYFLARHAACARLGGDHVGNGAEQDDREDAYCSVDKHDRHGMALAGLEDARQYADHAAFYQPKPTRREGDCSQEGADEGHEHGARHAQLDVGEAKGQNDEVESQRFGHPDNSGQKTQQWHTAKSDRPKHSFFEAVVEDDDSIWQWEEGDDSAPEVAHDDEGQDQNDDDDNAKGEDDLDRLGQVIEVGAEAPVAGQEAERRDGDQVQDPLHEDSAQGLRGRDRAVELEEVGAV